jgi:putative spermidine/putrescine transport system permease protein
MPAEPTPARRAAIRRFAGDWLPAVPLLLVAGAGLVAPMVAVALDAFRDDMTRAWTADNIGRLLANTIDRRAIVTSLHLAVIVATVAAVAGTPLAWTLAKAARRSRAAWLALLNVAAQFTGIPLAFAFVATLGTTGMITIALRAVGLDGLVPARDTVAALAVAYSYFSVPLFVLLILPATGVLRDEWWEAAQASGATRRQFWRHVGVPVLAPFVAAGWFLLFTWSIGQYAAAYALAGGGAGRRIELMTLRIGETTQTSISGVGRAAVHAVLLIVFSLAALTVYRRILRRAGRWLSG